MSIRPLSSEWMSGQQEERIAELEMQLQQLRETMEGLRETMTVNDEGALTIRATDIRIEAENNLQLRAGTECTVAGMSVVRIDSSGNLELRSASMNVSTGNQTVNSSMANYSGVIRCDTIIANSVVGSSYTPGAGNVW